MFGSFVNNKQTMYEFKVTIKYFPKKKTENTQSK